MHSPAPIASLTATSLSRAVARASSRFATFSARDQKREQDRDLQHDQRCFDPTGVKISNGRISTPHSAFDSGRSCANCFAIASISRWACARETPRAPCR